MSTLRFKSSNLDYPKMHINKVISYGDAWSQLLARPVVYESLVSAIGALTIEKIQQTELQGFFIKSPDDRSSQMQMQRYFTNALEASEWEDFRHLSPNSIYRFGLGHILNRVSTTLIFRRDGLNRWLFTHCPLAYRDGVIDIPIALMPLKECSDALLGQRNGYLSDFDRNANDLNALAPLSHRYHTEAHS